MPMRWPRQIGVKRSTTLTPVRTGAWTRPPRIGEGGPCSVDSTRSPASSGPAPSIGRPSASIDAAAPARVGPQRQRAVEVDARAEAAPTLDVEGLHGDPGLVDAHDLASCSRPPTARRTHSPRFTNLDRPVTAYAPAVASVTTPLMRSRCAPADRTACVEARQAACIYRVLSEICRAASAAAGAPASRAAQRSDRLAQQLVGLLDGPRAALSKAARDHDEPGQLQDRVRRWSPRRSPGPCRRGEVQHRLGRAVRDDAGILVALKLACSSMAKSPIAPTWTPSCVIMPSRATWGSPPIGSSRIGAPPTSRTGWPFSVTSSPVSRILHAPVAGVDGARRRLHRRATHRLRPPRRADCRSGSISPASPRDVGVTRRRRMRLDPGQAPWTSPCRT